MAANKFSRLKNSKMFFQVECTSREDPGTFWIHEKSDVPFYDVLEPALRVYAEGLPVEECFVKRQFVAAKRNGKWFRGQVKELALGARSERLHIFMLDLGITESIEKNLVRSLSSEFLLEPFRARKFCLYPLVPVAQEMDTESLKLTTMPCRQWTPFAQAWCSAFFKKQWYTFISIEGRDEEKVWYGRLYVSETPELDRDNLTCLNELLLVEGFAIEDYQRFPLTDWVPTNEVWQTSPASSVGTMNQTTPHATPQILPTLPLAAYSEEYARQKKAEDSKSKPTELSTTSSWVLDNLPESSPIPKGRGSRILSSPLPIVVATLDTRADIEHKANTSVSVASFGGNLELESHSRRTSSQRVVFHAAGVNLTSAPKPLPPKVPACVLNKAPTTHFDNRLPEPRTLPPVSPPSAAISNNSQSVSPVTQKSQVSPSTSVMNMLSALRKAKDTLPANSSTSQMPVPLQTSPNSPTPSCTQTDLALTLTTAQLTSSVTQTSSTAYTIPGNPPSIQTKVASVPSKTDSASAGPKSRLASLLENARKAKQATVGAPVPAQSLSAITPEAPVALKEVIKPGNAPGSQKPPSPVPQLKEKEDKMALGNEEAQAIEVSKQATVKPENVETVEAERDVTRPIAGASIAAARRMAGSGMFLSELERHKRVFVHGPNPVRPYTELQNTPLSDLLHRLITNEPWNLSALSQLQSHTWGSLLRGRNVAVIGPPGAKKTWSYLIPLVNNLLSPDEYTEVPIGCGPLAIILTASWEKAQSVYDDACELLRIQRDSVVRILYGSNLEGGRLTSLSNGSTLLVATLPAFVRALKHGPLVTNFDRCCHWVIEEADALCRYNQPEMEAVLKEYISSVKEAKLPMRQIVAVGQEWTPTLASFVNCMEKPLIYIGSAIEAAVFGGMASRAIIVRENNKEDLLLELVGSAMNHKKILIFCENSKEVEYVAGLIELLRDNSQVMKAHRDMTRTDVHGACQLWDNLASQQPAVFVTMDDVLPTLAIQNAELLIHYCLPQESKTGFGLRLTTAMKHFKATAFDADVPESVIFITDDVSAQLPTIVRFLRRTNAHVDPVLKARLREYLTQSERSKESLKLCLNTKLWGACQAKACPDRHYIVKAVDTPILPACGEVIISVSHVESATKYYARILRHINLQGKTQKFDMFGKINSSVAQYYAERDPEPVGGQLSVGQVCAVRKVAPLTEAVSYERVEVLRVFRDMRSPSSLPSEVDVQYIDHGKVQTESPDDLVYLCPDLASQPPSVAEIILPNVKPVDRDQTWNYEASSYVKGKIAKKELRGKIKLSLGNVLWLDPLVVQHRLDSQTVVNEWNVSRQLLFEGWAEPNPTHLEKLYAFCAGATLPLPDYTQSVSKGGTCTGRTAFLPEGVIEEVHVSSIVSPGLFYVQRTTFSQCLDDLQDNIDNYVAHLTKASLKSSKVSAGLICLAKFCLDDCFYRARVLKILPGTESKVQVFYLDFGDLGEVAFDDLRIVPDNFIMKLPYQAIPCSLAGISPISTDWNKEAIEIFNHCTQEGLVFKTLQSQMRRKTETMEETIYEIGLYSEEGRNVATVLVDNEVALITEEGNQHPDWLEDIPVEVLHRQSDAEDENEISEDDENWKVQVSADTANAEGLDFLGDPLAFVTEALGENCPPELIKLMELERKALEQEKTMTHTSQSSVQEVNNSTDAPPSAAVIARPVKTSQKPKLGEGFLVTAKLTAGGKANSVAKNRLETRTPTVQWADLSSGVKVTVLLSGLKHYRFVNSERSISFRAMVGGVKYVLSEKLYAEIDADKSVTQLQGNGLVVRLVKLIEAPWPRLLETDTKMPWLKADFDAGRVMEEESDEMLSLEECQRKTDEIRKKGAGRVTQGPVLDFDPDDESTNSEEEESDEDPALDVADNFSLV